MERKKGRRTAVRGRRVAQGRRGPGRAGRPSRQGGAEPDRRRLIQLLASVVLFLLVYIGRGILPGQAEAWREALSEDIDFQGAFRQFGQAVSEGGTVRDAFEALCASVLGGEQEPPESPAPDDAGGRPAASAKPVKLTMLSGTPRSGLSYLASSGALASPRGEPAPGADPSPAPSAPEETPAPPAEPVPTPGAVPTVEPVPTPDPSPFVRPTASGGGLVTAMAQTYDPEGRKLPSNISFEYYELGLEKTTAPVTGPATSYFGYRDSPVNGKLEFHLALDIGAAEGTPIGAFADGTVRYIGESDEFGLYFMIDHANNVSTFYAHCSKLLVHKGDKVTCGQKVALVGHTGNATGPHLHLTILKDNIRLDPSYYVEVT